MTAQAATLSTEDEYDFLAEDFEAYAEVALVIRTKAGALAPFVMNATQRYVHARIEEQRASTGMVRALILKARQHGVSTYVGGRHYWKTTHRLGFSPRLPTP